MNQTFKSLHRTNISKQTQFFTHSKQTLFRTNFCCGIIIKFRITYSRKQHCIRILTSLKSHFRKRITYFIDRIRTTDRIFITYFMTKFLANSIHHINALH